MNLGQSVVGWRAPVSIRDLISKPNKSTMNWSPPKKKTPFLGFWVDWVAFLEMVHVCCFQKQCEKHPNQYNHINHPLC